MESEAAKEQHLLCPKSGTSPTRNLRVQDLGQAPAQVIWGLAPNKANHTNMLDLCVRYLTTSYES